MSRVMTVLGPISPADLGFTLPHEHIFIDLTLFPGGKPAGGLDAIVDPIRHGEIMRQELADFQAVGGRSVVDLTVRNMGGDIQEVKRMAEMTGLNIIAGCGWYRESYMDHDIYYRPTEELAEALIYEIEHGIDGTDIHPGIIGEVGTNQYHLTAKEERCLRAMAKAQRRTGLTLTTHLPKPGVGIEALNILVEHGVPPERIVLGHCDSYLNLDYNVMLAKSGGYIQYDNIRAAPGMPHGDPDLIDLVADLVRLGFTRQILLSHDVCWRSRMKHWGGSGFDFLVTHFLPKLREKGVSDGEIHIMTVENPARILAV